MPIAKLSIFPSPFSHHNAVTSLMQNFKHLALNSDSTESERYLAESCEYVTCTLHCDVPAIYHLCGVDTAELVGLIEGNCKLGWKPFE
jgi:hypothetical protein